MGEEGEGMEIARTILPMANNLRLDVVAEGVETIQQVAMPEKNCTVNMPRDFTFPGRCPPRGPRHYWQEALRGKRSSKPSSSNDVSAGRAGTGSPIRHIAKALTVELQKGALHSPNCSLAILMKLAWQKYHSRSSPASSVNGARRVFAVFLMVFQRQSPGRLLWRRPSRLIDASDSRHLDYRQKECRPFEFGTLPSKAESGRWLPAFPACWKLAEFVWLLPCTARQMEKQQVVALVGGGFQCGKAVSRFPNAPGLAEGNVA